MKSINIKTVVGAALLSVLSVGCSDILEEQPRSLHEPSFFSTPTGVQGGISALYSSLRNIYGNGYYLNAVQTGTDEATWGQGADANFKVLDYSNQGELNSTSSRSDVLWNEAFPAINTASGIIENGAGAGASTALIAEARFFRAFYYFQLVQTFGGVPLDLGSGELKFNTNPKRTSARNTVPEVYTKAVFPDLLQAVNELPDAPRLTGAVTKTVARLFLSKAYLTYGWWLQNPNNIPTYPQANRTDPNGQTAQYYFQQAYDVATTAIDNPGPYGLVETYYDVNRATNDRNKEHLLYADHTEKSSLYNGGDINGFASGSAPDNFAGWFYTWNYTELRSNTAASATATQINTVQREAVQPLGRPWFRMTPPIDIFVNTFADKTLDSRYDGTFTTVYRGNWNKNPNNASTTVVYNANLLPVSPGEPILTFLNSEPATPITYPNGAGRSNVGAGELPGRADYVVSPLGINRRMYPGLWKLGPYRTDNGTGFGNPNAGSTRPFYIAKFSEFYFIAAEAAVKGATVKSGKSARDLINVIRGRAGKWRWSNAQNTTKVEDNSVAMMAATPAIITVDYILQERSREYFGEGYRWLDLIRTQKWNEFASTYRIGGVNFQDHTPQTVTRTIQPQHYLRPIPRGQIDAMQATPEEKAAYQNPGYQ
ncbi:RagB/SusD family nutrient uptake outer membrane protein [Pedobacter sp. SYSU D00535]|uniref:RagB/SusD family nutrient uptake outer membrane protein n=1 Tax=Pedobacter sp. SYSU D00535 TaxID=2810308 RepID=UPI001A956F9B|nr:RagB/SusD family nutrient uptake outer membrane protein [Pedobacter sp. SYSU D00535]